MRNGRISSRLFRRPWDMTTRRRSLRPQAVPKKRKNSEDGRAHDGKLLAVQPPLGYGIADVTIYSRAAANSVEGRPHDRRSALQQHARYSRGDGDQALRVVVADRGDPSDADERLGFSRRQIARKADRRWGRRRRGARYSRRASWVSMKAQSRLTQASVVCSPVLSTRSGFTGGS